MAAALLAPEVIIAALAILEVALEILEIALAIMALLRLFHVLGKVASGKTEPEPYRVLLQDQGPTRGSRDREAIYASGLLVGQEPITVKEGLRGITALA